MLMEAQPKTLSPEVLAQIDAILVAHDHDLTQIVGILLDTQELFEQHYVPQVAAYYIAQALPVPVARIYEAITFYDALSCEPRAKYPIQVCNNVCCKLNNNQFVLDTLRGLLGIEVGETTYDGRFRLETCACFGACDVAPAVRVNGKVYGHLDSEDKIRALLGELA